MKKIEQEDMKKEMRTPTGSLKFIYYNAKELFDPTIGPGVILKNISGNHIFVIEKTNNLVLNFHHSCPSRGTYTAALNLSDIPVTNDLGIAISWSPAQISFLASHLKPPHSTASKQSNPNPHLELSVNIKGDLSISEGQGINNVRIYEDGELILKPYAIDLWHETKTVIDMLFTGESKEGYQYESAICNAALCMTVTGLETYLQSRFLELDLEGYQLHLEKLIKKIASNDKRDQLLKETEKVSAEGKSPIPVLLKRIKFQNFDNAKKVFNQAYCLVFGDLPLQSGLIEKIQQILKYRHQITHVTPSPAPYNIKGEFPPKAPSIDLAKNSLKAMDDFITTLHEKSITLPGRKLETS